MDNPSEVMKVKARYFAGAMGALMLALGFDGAGRELAAQQQTLQRGQTPGPRFMVPVFRSNERNVGWQFADALRERMGGDFMARTLYIIVKSDIDNALEQSGYSKTEPLNSNDSRQLANLIRAEEYVEGAINKTDAGYEFEGAVLLVRGDGMVQPLPKVAGAKLSDLTKGVSNAVESARKPVDDVKNCTLKWRQNKFAEAMADASKGLKDYPTSVMARVCILELANSQKWGPDSIIRVGEEILSAHPTNRRALTLLADAYSAKKLDEKYISTLTKLLAADPTNVRLVETVVEAIARTKQFQVARPIIDEAIKQNPGDPALIRMQWRIYLAIKEYAAAAAIGEEMIKTDTAAADTNFYNALVGAYTAANDSAKALEAASRGTAKFPTNVGLWQVVGQLARQQGQLPVALNAYQKIASVDPKTPRIQLEIARILMEQNQNDAALEALKAASAAGDDKAMVAGLANGVANRLFQAFQKSDPKDPALAAKTLEVLTFAESHEKSATTYLLMGAVNLVQGLTALQEAQPEKSCDKAKKAKDHMVEAQIHLPKAGADPRLKDQVAGMLAQVTQYGEVPDQMVKAYCK
jgi:tetratricopeptide (TPR) repeat protein